VPCVATCNWGYTGGSAPTATCQTVPYGDPTYTTWVISGGSCNREYLLGLLSASLGSQVEAAAVKQVVEP
jgi:hypothetical protein